MSRVGFILFPLPALEPLSSLSNVCCSSWSHIFTSNRLKLESRESARHPPAVHGTILEPLCFTPPQLHSVSCSIQLSLLDPVSQKANLVSNMWVQTHSLLDSYVLCLPRISPTKPRFPRPPASSTCVLSVTWHLRFLTITKAQGRSCLLLLASCPSMS